MSADGARVLVSRLERTPELRALAAEAMLRVARMVAPPGVTLELERLKGDALAERKIASTMHDDRGQNAA